MKNRPLCSACLIFFLFICILIYGGGDKAADLLYPSPLKEHVKEGGAVRLTGQVYKKEIRDKYQILYLKNNSIYYQEQSLKESRIMLYDEKKVNVHIGQGITAEGELSFFEPAYNPGNFDRKSYYERQGLRASVWCERVEALDQNRSALLDYLYSFRQEVSRTFGKYMSEEDSAVLSAMILGEKNGMDAELKGLYAANGIGHIVCVSGVHTSILGINVSSRNLGNKAFVGSFVL